MAVEGEMVPRLRNLWREEQGQDLIEYSLLIAFLAMACISFFSMGNSSIAGIVNKSTSQLVAGNQYATS
jgi:Flp pilus assembly pilin Flp